MTVMDRVEDFLIQNKPYGFCDDCLADNLRLTPRQHANHKSLELARTRKLEYARSVGECHACKSVKKKVVRAI